MKPPNTSRRKVNTFEYTYDARGAKESPKDCSNLKSCDPVTRALMPPFKGRRRDFYIPKVSSDPRNIPNVNTYMNVFYISYIYKLATSSHTKSGLFEATSLTWLPADSQVSPHAATSELGLQRIPEFRAPDFMVSRVHDSGSSQDRDLKSFAGSRLQIFTGSRLPNFAGSRFQIFASSRLRGFAGSRFQIFASSRLWGFAGSRFLKTHFTNFNIPDVSRVTGFPEFPNNTWPGIQK
jgi:hypothetical protein